MNYKTYGTDAFLCKISTKRPILGRLIDVLRQGGTDVARINFLSVPLQSGYFRDFNALWHASRHFFLHIGLKSFFYF